MLKVKQYSPLSCAAQETRGPLAGQSKAFDLVIYDNTGLHYYASVFSRIDQMFNRGLDQIMLPS